jgi:transcriptional regulator of acetoin/glycerol metabolism
LIILMQYDWPGNVRELHNVIERAAVLVGDDRVLSPASLGLTTLPAHAPCGVGGANGGFHESKEQLIAAWEREYITNLLQRCGGNVTRAAREAGLDRAHLHRLLRKHGLAAAG